MAEFFDRLKTSIFGIPDHPDKILYESVTNESLEGPQGLLDSFLGQVGDQKHWYDFKITQCDAGKQIADLDHANTRLMVLALISRLLPIQKKLNGLRKDKPKDHHQDKIYQAFNERNNIFEVVLRSLLRRKLPFTATDLLFLLDYILLTTQAYFSCFYSPIGGVVKAVETYAQDNELTAAILERLRTMDGAFKTRNAGSSDERKVHARILSLLGEGIDIKIIAGEAWADTALNDLGALDETSRYNWQALLQHCQSATSSKPSAAWTKQAKSLLDDIGLGHFQDFVSRWFVLVEKPRTVEITDRARWGPDPNLMINEQNMDILKGLTWCCTFEESDVIAKAINRLAITSYKKVPGIGPRATRVGNACVYALGAMPGMAGVYQLALLKVRVNFRTALKGIEKALATAGERVGMSVDELEEIGVPAYGLTEVGSLTEQLGDFTANLVVTGTTSTEIRWIKSDGKTQKSVPKDIKEHYAEELKELNTAAKDIQKMLPAQRQRIDNLYLQQHDWLMDHWKQYYLDHPLVGYHARRLIWKFTNAERTSLGIWHNGQIVDAKGQALTDISSDTKVSLWHPIESDVDEITTWREWLESQEVIQPFKQAHREIYILTDAERTTNVYSNRFAAHIIKQHQFNALAAQRGWRYALQGCWDAPEETARLVLPKWGLWAEFWVDGIGEYGQDTTEAGVFFYVSTDQVRFYAYGNPDDLKNITWSRTERENGPMPLAEIPPLVLSEVFRDVDLFVGVGSVGNDPEWSDGGPQGRYRDYWTAYSFGDLNATARTRKEVLERLIPRLKIANRCEITDKFLIVRGDVRTYKIHLGSGNILMTPNDQYLCIVLARGNKDNDNRIFLPFEGDSMMSIILSKAFLLAEDKKIKDSTILNQIQP